MYNYRCFMAPEVPKSSDSYKTSLKYLQDELPRLIAQREQVDERIARVREGIAAMEGLTSASSSPGQSAKKGLTASVRKIMKGSDWLAPTQIRDALRKEGTDVGSYSNILAEVHLILKRLGSPVR